MKLSPSIALVCIINMFCIALMLLQAFWPFPLYDGTNAVFEGIDIVNGLSMVINYLFLAYLLYYFKVNIALSVFLAVLAALGLLNFAFAPNQENFLILSAFGAISFLLSIIILVLAFRIKHERIKFSVVLILIVLVSTAIINMLFPFAMAFFLDKVDVTQANLILQLFIVIVLRLSFVFGFMKLKQAL